MTARILVVEDSATDAYRLRLCLESRGYEVDVASSGEDGLRIARSDEPDLILMDVVMPGINGFQATRQLTRDRATQHIPVVIVTTKAQETDRLWGLRQGAKAFLAKPIDEALLVDTVEQALLT